MQKLKLESATVTIQRVGGADVLKFGGIASLAQTLEIRRRAYALLAEPVPLVLDVSGFVLLTSSETSFAPYATDRPLALVSNAAQIQMVEQYQLNAARSGLFREYFGAIEQAVRWATNQPQALAPVKLCCCG